MKIRRDDHGLIGVPRPYAGPLYLQISELLRERIRSRDWVEGQALPNEGDLAREYGVSVGTMRKALEQVEAIGWISRRQGRGTFVTNSEATSARRLDPFFDGDKHVFPDAATVLSICTRDASLDEASWLALEGNEKVVSIVAVRRSDGVVAIHDDIAIPLLRAPELADSIAADPQSFAKYRSYYGRVVVRLKEAVTATALPDEIAAALGQPPASPALLSRRISFGADGEPIDLCVRHAVPMSAEYRIELS